MGAGQGDPGGHINDVEAGGAGGGGGGRVAVATAGVGGWVGGLGLSIFGVNSTCLVRRLSHPASEEISSLQKDNIGLHMPHPHPFLHT